MTIECWTVIHRVTEPIRRAAPIRRIARHWLHKKPPVHAAPSAHVPAHVLHAARVAAPHARTWVEVVCRVLPAAAVGSGLLIPHPAGPLPIPPAPPPAIVMSPPTLPMPPRRVIMPPPSEIAPPIGPQTYLPPPPRDAIPEPGSIAILLSGLAGLALAPGIWRRHRRDGQREFRRHP